MRSRERPGSSVALDEFLRVAVDLYATNRAYRSEIDQERPGAPLADARDRPLTTRQRLNELDWLIRNGEPIPDACSRLGWSTVQLAQLTARRQRHPVHQRLLPETESGASEEWARRWLAGAA